MPRVARRSPNPHLSGKKPKPKPKPRAPGVIRLSEAYTKEAFMRRLGVGLNAWWALVKAGIPHKQVGKKKIILGKDVLRYLDRLPDVQPTPPKQPAEG